jgi:hypothetical protein
LPRIKFLQNFLVKVNKNFDRLKIYFWKNFIYIDKNLRLNILNKLELNLCSKIFYECSYFWLMYTKYIRSKLENTRCNWFNDWICVWPVVCFVLIPKYLIILSILLDVYIYNEFYFIYISAPLSLIVIFKEYSLHVFRLKSYKWLKQLQEGFAIKKISNGEVMNGLDFIYEKENFVSVHFDLNNYVVTLTGKYIKNYDLLAY